ncbi:kinase binding protein CGI-121-domain-containing protein [Polychytrium aggregatum]|uniref:kinase binding protein CGI-121-domain-containing protein n=1 Tax=Polychytrium aggregatum TaxID=110093 RepID=UPI0022FF13A2|nr:kinase binding protein CGI-121-domain-containing protein [Polychytrium aggregatum]KAI9205623.1 kinase binding protein CGI-121-domain-containing protein [Polychytrium aggregatum]
MATTTTTTLPLPGFLVPPPSDHPYPSVAVHQDASVDPCSIHVSLFVKVQNPAQIKNTIIKSPDTIPQCSMLDARKVLDPSLIQLAAQKAILARVQGKMKTKSIYSELLFNFTPGTSITESLKFFGVSDKTNAIFVVFIGEPSAEGLAKIQSLVQGELVPLSRHAELVDLQAVEKIYKLGSSNAAERLSLVTSSMALKGYQ